MSRLIKIATVQPPAALEGQTADSIENQALDLLEQAAGDGADIVCLPEYLNCMACTPQQASERTGRHAENLLQHTAEIAKKHRCHVIAPVVIDTQQGRFNRAVLLGRDGEMLGHYDKVHLTLVERREWGIQPGASWPVFGCDFGKIGIMICYDGCFPESCRILALQGAEIVFWPGLQRGFSESELLLQVQSHAYFNRIHVVRSSYGTPKNQPWRPGMMVGLSCVCGDDGVLMASTGRWVGWTGCSVDLDAPQRGFRSFGGSQGTLRTMHFEDRRPETYERLTKT
ncbi:MAG: carbon-nitrogen hydrolase family protein [Sedimentisphaerales bacterium]|nr:carbon-nitrogen hydrolase family protein [Sedimentisphaerales bacterium]